MPCVYLDGRPTPSGMPLLRSLRDGASSTDETASRTGQLLFRVRSGLQELRSAEFVEEKENKYGLSNKGRMLLQ